MRFKRHLKIEKGLVDMTPLVNVFFLLFIFFMFTSSFIFQPGIKVNLPKASSAALLQSNTKAITIDTSGQVYYEAFPVSMTELEDRLRIQEAQTPDFPVVVKGDGQVQYAKVVEVLDLLRRLDMFPDDQI